VRQKYDLCVYGYVVAPEHVHLLVSEPEHGTLAQAMQSLKQTVARRLPLRAPNPFWQERYYDFDVWSECKFLEKLRYLHLNPVTRGPLARPDDWAWEQFPSLSERRVRPGGDRVAVDSPQEGASRNLPDGAPASTRKSPPKRSLDGAPSRSQMIMIGEGHPPASAVAVAARAENNALGAPARVRRSPHGVEGSCVFLGVAVECWGTQGPSAPQFHSLFANEPAPVGTTK
jgi:REP element-mobilizing transposase RayT